MGRKNKNSTEEPKDANITRQNHITAKMWTDTRNIQANVRDQHWILQGKATSYDVGIHGNTKDKHGTMANTKPPNEESMPK